MILVLALVACKSSENGSTQQAVSTAADHVPPVSRPVDIDPEIELVKNGVIPQYNTTTVGKAFEGTFQNPKWTKFETPKGQTVVQFDGTIQAIKLTEKGFVEFDSIYEKAAAPLVDGCIEKLGLTGDQPKFDSNWMTTTPSSTLLSNRPLDIEQYNVQKCVAAQVAIPVQFQFVLTADHRSFQVGYFDEAPFRINRQADIERVLTFIYE